MKFRSRHAFILATSASVLLAESASAQTATGWTGAADTLWSTNANWDNGAPPGGDTNTRSLFFGNAWVTAGSTGAIFSQNDLTGYAGHRITFEDTSLAIDPAFTITGNAFTLFDFGGAFPRIENDSTSLQTFNLSGALTLNGGAGGFSEIDPVNGNLLFSATTPVVVTGGQQLRIFGNNGKTVTFNGVISGALSTLSINQNSNVVFGAVNTFSGDTFINAGALSFAEGGGLSGGTLQLGDTAATGAGATLRISDGDGGTTVARPIVVRAGSTGVKTIAATNGSGTNTFSGTIALNDNVTFDVSTGGALTASGVVSGASGVTKTGAGILSLTAANSFAGGLTINGGTVRPTVVNTMAGGITINTGGTLETTTGGADSAAYTTFFGVASNPITINGGRLLDTNAADRTVTNRPITVGANGATIEVLGILTAFQEVGVITQLRFATAAPLNDILTGSGTLTKDGQGRLTLNSGSSPNFSGAWVINNGTVEALNTNLGNASATNTVLINGGILATSGGTVAQAITLNGGALATTGGNRIVSGPITAAADSYVFLNDFWRDFDSAGATNNIGRTINHTGLLTGSAAIGVAVNRANYNFNNGSFIVQNPGSTYSGTITVGKNLRLENNSTTGFGKTIGTAAIVLADGGLNLRDNGSAGGVTGTTFAYGNDVSVVAASGIFARGTIAGSVSIDVNRASGTVAAGNVFKLGGLTNGSQTLNVTGGNGYGLEFGGASTLTANATFNVTAGSLGFSGGLGESGGARSLTKIGAGALTFTSVGSYTGATTVTGSTLSVGGAAGKLTATSSIALTDAALLIDNSASDSADRIANGVAINLANSSITLTSLASAANDTAESLGTVTLLSGKNAINATQTAPGVISALTIASLVRTSGATVSFGGTNLGQPGNSSRIILGNQTSTPFMGAWATVGGSFAKYSTSLDGGFGLGVAAVDCLVDTDESTWATGQNICLTGTATATLTASRVINSLSFANTLDSRTVDVAGNTLKIESAGIIVGTNAAVITGSGGLTAGTGTAAEFILTNNAALNIAAPIIDNGGGVVSLLKTGTGALTLSGVNTFSGDIRVDQGALVLGNVGNLGTPSALGISSTLRLSTGSNLAPLQYTGVSAATDHALTAGSAGTSVDVTTSGAVLTWNGNITSAGPLTKLGAGTFAITGTNNISGDIATTAGTLALGGTTGVGGSATVGAGTTLRIDGAATIGGDLNVGLNGGTGSVIGTAGATLSIGSGAASSINIGSRNNAVNTTTNGTLDLAASAGFTANVGNLRIENDFGTASNGAMTGLLRLPNSSTAVNFITATNAFLVGNSPNEGANATATVNFGGGSTTIATPAFTVGGVKTSALANIGAGGSLNFSTAAGRAALSVGVNTVDTGTTPSSTFDLTGGTVTGGVGAINIGYRSGGGAGKVTGVLNLGTSATTNLDVNVSAGFAARIGGLDYSVGTQPTTETATGTLIIGGGNVSFTSTVAASSAIVVGYFNNTALTITGGTNAATGTFTIGGGNVTVTSAGTNNAINLAPRTVNGTPGGTQSASATLNINGGSLTVNNQIAGNSTVTNSTSTLNLAAGVLNMQGKNLTSINNVNFSGGTLRNLGTLNRALTQTGETSLLDVAANNATISGAYAVTDGDINIAASRTLAATSTALSGTATAIVNGSITGSLTVNAGATVMGSGTTAALTLAGGTIAPGNSPGILNTGALSLGGGTLSLELNGLTAGTEHDQINTIGTVTLTADTAFTLSLGFTPANNSTFTILNNDAADAIVLGANRLVYNGNRLEQNGYFVATGGQQFTISYSGGTGNDVVLTAIPEPASLATLLAGAGVLLGLRRRRQS